MKKVFKSVIDSKNGRIWINDPLKGEKLILVAEITKDRELYMEMLSYITKIRDNPEFLAQMIRELDKSNEAE